MDRVDVGAMIQEHPGSLPGTCGHGDMQWGRAAGVRLFDPARVFLEQGLDHVQRVSAERVM